MTSNLTTPKIVVMVPARTGSKRIKSKNLRFLDGKPLISYVLNTVRGIQQFNHLYVNSDGEVFRQIAKDHGFQFYRRNAELANDTATNDAFGYDFLKHVDCDYLLQVLPTSPFITAEEIRAFTDHMVERDLDGLISVEPHQIACVYNGEAINFHKDKVNPPSQDMQPVYSYATVLMGWKRDAFIKNYEDLGVAYHTPRGKVDYFPITGISAIDIDNEEDFLLAEAIMQAKSHISSAEPQYYKET